jgi:hypothetical protein
MAARSRRSATTVEAPAETEAVQEEIVPVTVTDDVYEESAVATEDASAEKGKPGRKADPTRAAVARFSEAKKNLAKARELPPIADLETEFAEAKAALTALLADDLG